MLPVKQNGKWGYVNPQGELIIPATFIFADQFKSGRAMVGTESGVGMMDAQGSWLIKPEFEYISWLNFHHGGFIQGAFNCPEGQKYFGKYSVDGYNAVTKTVYQFRG